MREGQNEELEKARQKVSNVQIWELQSVQKI